MKRQEYKKEGEIYSAIVSSSRLFSGEKLFFQASQWNNNMPCNFFIRPLFRRIFFRPRNETTTCHNLKAQDFQVTLDNFWKWDSIKKMTRTWYGKNSIHIRKAIIMKITEFQQQKNFFMKSLFRIVRWLCCT